MRLQRMLAGVNVKSVKNFKNYNIKSVTHISKDVLQNSMFLCIKGGTFDGNDYVDDAILRGAKCVVTENENLEVDSTIIIVDDIRIAMSVIAKNFYNKCCDDMKIVGIVGTAGKTSTSLILAQILHKYDNNLGVIGTNGVFIGENRLESAFTTPDPLELHYAFYQMKLLGVKIVVMEVSAQAIYYKKVYGVEFDICVFTNISNEHLDFFESMEKYAKVKMDFFNSNNMKECVVNIDDFYGRELAYKVDIPCVSYGVTEPANSFAINVDLSLNRTKFVANILDDVIECDVALVGDYSVYNILAGLTVAKMLGMKKDALQKAVNDLQVIDGRFNVYNIGRRKIVIDFAHTPDSISKLMTHIKEHSNCRIVSLFGCVGYSDKQKRYEMSKAVADNSDMIVVTSDNPGKTPFDEICKDIISGLGNKNFVCIEDRCLAIEYAFNLLKDDEMLVLIGKGAETFQMIGDVRVPYSDKECVMRLMEKCN